MTSRAVSFESLSGIPARAGGLHQDEVERQRVRFGANDIVEISGHPLLELVRDTLRDPMVWFLLGIAIVFLLLGQKRDAIILFVALVPLLLMDLLLHRRAQASTRELRGRLASNCFVHRGDQVIEIPVARLVPGDLVRLEPGQSLPADGIFQKSRGLQLDESSLTGESLPVGKQHWEELLRLWPSGGERLVPESSLGFAGTRVLTGEGELRVTQTGRSTGYGQIVRSVSDLPHESTPLQQAISRLVSRLIVAALAFCVLLAGIRMVQGHGWLDALLSAATLAVAAIPEEFPVVFTFFLGVGVYRLARRKALVRRAVTVENMGRVDLICTDKTGTLTEGVLTLNHRLPVSGVSEQELLEAAAWASRAESLDPMDQAILDLLSMERGDLQPDTRRVLAVFPFTEDRKREVVIRQDGSRRPESWIKGAPEEVLPRTTLSDAERREWSEHVDRLSSEGHKVLACGRLEMHDLEDGVGEGSSEPQRGYQFLGLLAFEDPARPDVASAVRACEEAGIRVLMITGDHPNTAAAICRDIGLGGGNPRVVSAEEHAAHLVPEWLESNPSWLDGVHAIARCRPLQKLAVVQAFRRSGRVVAVTGDGVNDVPALKAADIGIAMGLRGTRGAREVSSIILSDDRFSTIVGAIGEGRQLFDNLRRSFEYLLLFHIPFVATAAIVPLLGYPLLYLPLHVVWLELLIHPTALLAFQQEARPGIPPGARDGDFFSNAQASRILLVGLLMALLVAALGILTLNSGGSIELARSRVLVLLGIWSAVLAAYLSRLRTRAARWIVALTVLASMAIAL